MLHLIGLGLGTEDDLTLRSLKILKGCDQIFIDTYTSLSNLNLKNLETMISNKITILNRYHVEGTDNIIEAATKGPTAFLVIGTPLFATTHFEVLSRAKDMGVKINVLHNASILNVFGVCGLYSYAFGRTISIPWYTDTWKPRSFFDYFLKNYKNNLHTLCLLDLKDEEKTDKYGQTITVKKCMDPATAVKQLIFCDKNSESAPIITDKDYKIIVVSRFGSNSESYSYLHCDDLIKKSFGEPLHSLILPSKMDVIESDNLRDFFKHKNGFFDHSQ